uniref:Uncharacterized protein n=1 Tax=Glossina palpalis gambiensis TaxID=67801 RepID=A0A1B0BMF5_9MUSC
MAKPHSGGTAFVITVTPTPVNFAVLLTRSWVNPQMPMALQTFANHQFYDCATPLEEKTARRDEQKGNRERKGY